MRLVVAVLAGIAVAGAGAVVLGDYPLSGSVPWLASVVIPFLIGAAMILIAGRPAPWLWVATAVLAPASLTWGFRVASDYGIDTVPTPCWVAVGIAFVWPLTWAVVSLRRSRPRSRPADPTGGPGVSR